MGISDGEIWVLAVCCVFDINVVGTNVRTRVLGCNVGSQNQLGTEIRATGLVGARKIVGAADLEAQCHTAFERCGRRMVVLKLDINPSKLNLFLTQIVQNGLLKRFCHVRVANPKLAGHVIDDFRGIQGIVVDAFTYGGRRRKRGWITSIVARSHAATCKLRRDIGGGRWNIGHQHIRVRFCRFRLGLTHVPSVLACVSRRSAVRSSVGSKLVFAGLHLGHGDPKGIVIETWDAGGMKPVNVFAGQGNGRKCIR